MVSSARGIMEHELSLAPWTSLELGILSFNILGDGVRDMFDAGS